MRISVPEYIEIVKQYYYSEPGSYVPENDPELTVEEIMLITFLFYWNSKGRDYIETDDFPVYSYYEFDYIEWISTLNKELKQGDKVDWSSVLRDRRGKKTEIFYSEYFSESPWWSSEKYKDLYQKHYDECKKYWYFKIKEDEHRKGHQKAVTALERCRIKAKKDVKNGKGT